jgi:hypothetical protein
MEEVVNGIGSLLPNAAHRLLASGSENVQKRHLIATAAHNLSILIHRLYGIGTARSMQGMARAISAVLLAIPLRRSLTKTFCDRIRDNLPTEIDFWTHRGRVPKNEVRFSKTLVCSMGCYPCAAANPALRRGWQAWRPVRRVTELGSFSNQKSEARQDAKTQRFAFSPLRLCVLA